MGGDLNNATWGNLYLKMYLFLFWKLYKLDLAAGAQSCFPGSKFLLVLQVHAKT
jgi:hypothetical protein